MGAQAFGTVPSRATNQIPLLDFGEPEGRVQQVGRWTYRVWINDGLTSYDYGWHVIGRGRAERKARTALARYLRRETRFRNEWTITR